jgi:hypothetical protein
MAATVKDAAKRRSRATRPTQLGLPGADAAPRRAGSNPNGHGGRRKGAGRKRTLPGPARGAHRARPFHDRRLPVHVVLRVTQELGRLRRAKAYAAVRLAMIALVPASASCITKPRQARHTLAYVLNNWRRHREDHVGLGEARASVDRYSSGIAFNGWAERDGVPFAWPPGFEPLPIAAPQTWLPQEGWRRGGAPPSLWEVPGPA